MRAVPGSGQTADPALATMLAVTTTMSGNHPLLFWKPVRCYLAEAGWGNHQNSVCFRPTAYSRPDRESWGFGDRDSSLFLQHFS